MLKIVAGIHSSDAGELFINGEPVALRGGVARGARSGESPSSTRTSPWSSV